MIAQNRRYVPLAYDWHGGQWSAYYSYASTDGIVHNDEHLKSLISETEKNISLAETKKEKQRLENFLGWLHSLAKPCEDCVSIHGDDPEEWLKKWPQGAEWHEEYKAYLCDGCADERDANDDAEWHEDFYA